MASHIFGPGGVAGRAVAGAAVGVVLLYGLPNTPPDVMQTTAGNAVKEFYPKVTDPVVAPKIYGNGERIVFLDDRGVECNLSVKITADDIVPDPSANQIICY